MKPLGEEDMERGTINRATVCPHRVIDSAIRHKASIPLLVHGRPNGNPASSERDTTITEAGVLAGINIDISFIENFAVTTNAFSSFREAGLL